MPARKLRAALSAAGVVTALLLPAGAAAAAGTTPAPTSAVTAARVVYLLDCEGDRAKVRPREVVLACADGGSLVEAAVWKQWGDPTATASALLTENDCVPNCADGTFHSEPANISVSIIEKRHGRYEYRHIRVVPAAPNRYHFPTLALTIPG